jgi:photosystem II stability/assembly factor-like uncharacterized protein
VGHSDVRRSTDGGATWTTHVLSDSFVGYPQGLAAFPDGTCFCATHGGTNVNFMYRSTDGGETWHLRNNGFGMPDRVNDIFFLDSQRGFACGGATLNPAILRTTDGGGLWTPVGESGLVGDDIRDMHWFDANVGVVVGFTRAQRTTNGGGSWSTVLTGSAAQAIDFADAFRGVACSYDNRAATTTDGGATWSPLVVPLPGFLSDVVTTPTGFLAAGSSNGIVGFDADAGPVAVEPFGGVRESAGTLAVWPNPFNVGTAASLRFRVPDGRRPVEARLFDVGGRLLRRASLDGDTPVGSLALGSPGLPPGVFVLELRGSRGERWTRKVAAIR